MYMTKLTYATTLCAALLFLPIVGMAQDDGDETETPSDPLPNLIEIREQLMDEVVVIGEKTTIQLRREIQAADIIVYDIFNELNTDDDYDIVCRKEARIGSQIVNLRCKSQLFWEARSALAEDDDAIATPQPVSNRARHEQVLQEKVRELAMQDSDLLQAMLRREILKRELARRKEE